LPDGHFEEQQAVVTTYARGTKAIERVPISVRHLQGRQYLVKLITDRVLAAMLVLLLLPVFGLIALLIKLDSPGPVLFRQFRVGRHGRVFSMLKFRSMIKDASRYQRSLALISRQDGTAIFKMRNDPRVTRIGRFLRQTSLDELPQLFNVLRGEMSLVGPRPPLITEVTCEWLHMSRLEAMPGITGLWQVSGRSELPFEEMRRLDLEYIRRWSLIEDWLILLRTIPVVLNRKGAY
jgi:lipopolysaccharide/colanic/teichoic acid biosynthesis glycosyltransferase